MFFSNIDVWEGAFDSVDISCFVAFAAGGFAA
jgi:hypothetical protein